MAFYATSSPSIMEGHAFLLQPLRILLPRTPSAPSSQLPGSPILPSELSLVSQTAQTHLSSLASKAVAVALVASVLFRKHSGRSGRSSLTGSRRGSVLVAAAAATEAPPRPPKEEPTPFPENKFFPRELKYLIELFSEEEPDQEELIEAIQDFHDLHAAEVQWGSWPDRLHEVPNDHFNEGLFTMLRGTIKCIEQEENEDLRWVAVDLLKDLILGGCALTRCPETFVVEAGAAGILCKVAGETEDATILQILKQLVQEIAIEMIPPLIEKGLVDVCLDVIENYEADAMDQLLALDIIASLCKQAPLKVAEAGTYEVVKGVSNAALVARRNKIMNTLRPLVHSESETPITTTIRVRGPRIED
eukprot:TRINITY_DN2858_c0_g3_i1.p1 TRINITY_DN2858_c0_g3~~TRINITY_DN2858_c0_g3_i1.p1  ORF type:complete len:370 (+),score=73.18 TRINITY_DN2858_c0_g3_i1:30-1112(+)